MKTGFRDKPRRLWRLAVATHPPIAELVVLSYVLQEPIAAPKIS